MVRRGLMLAAVMLACLSLAGRSFGSDINAEVLQRLKALEDNNKALQEKNKQLEAQVTKAMAPKSATAAVDRAMAAEDAKMGSVVTDADPHCRPLKIGGYFDVGYEYNLNNPDNQLNNQRVFDKNDANSFDVHLASLNFSRLPEKPGQAGFRMDIDYGTDQRVYKSQDGNALATERSTQFMDTDLRQAYIEYIVPIGCDRGVTLDVGKFVTWAGAEVIQASDNMNQSRSLLFGDAIPFTHTGVRATYDVWKSDCGMNWTVGAGIVNGWDNIQDTNKPKTAMFMSDLKPVKWFDWIVVGIVGNEQAVDERLRLAAATAIPTLAAPDGGPFAGSQFSDLSDPTIQGNKSSTTGKIFDSGDGSQPRGLIDTTLTFTPWDKWTFALNGDYATEGQRMNILGHDAIRNAHWWGGAFYAKYQFAANWYIANRVEYFADPQGVRTGRRTDQWEDTVTLDWALSDPLHMRFEYRHDNANEELFSSHGAPSNTSTHFGDPFRRSTQDTIGVSWLYKW